MGIKTYVSLENIYSQGKKIRELDDAVVRNGACLMLSINWLIQVNEQNSIQNAFDWLNQDDDKTIDVLFKQIAGQHRFYSTDVGGAGAESVRKMLDLATKGAMESWKEVAFTDADMATQVKTAVEDTPKMVLIVFKCGGGGYHGIGIAIDENNLCGIFDPNFGLITIQADDGVISNTGRFETVIAELIETYSIPQGCCYEIRSV